MFDPGRRYLSRGSAHTHLGFAALGYKTVTIKLKTFSGVSVVANEYHSTRASCYACGWHTHTHTHSVLVTCPSKYSTTVSTIASQQLLQRCRCTLLNLPCQPSLLLLKRDLQTVHCRMVHHSHTISSMNKPTMPRPINASRQSIKGYPTTTAIL